MQNETITIKYGSRIIKFDLYCSKRRTLEISVYPDLRVQVKASVDKSIDDIKERVKKRAQWILQQQNFFSLYLPKQPPKQYISGESHYYLGRQYRLKVISADTDVIKLQRGVLFVNCIKRNDPIYVKKLLNKWYRKRAEELFIRRLDICCERVKPYKIDKPLLKLKKMVKRWGSCSKSTIILNSELVKTPSLCIDYVIIHEMCHLKFPNHSQNFYNLLNKTLPDWQKRKKRLEQICI